MTSMLNFILTHCVLHQVIYSPWACTSSLMEMEAMDIHPGLAVVGPWTLILFWLQFGP